jgi:hypothetical protein
MATTFADIYLHTVSISVRGIDRDSVIDALREVISQIENGGYTSGLGSSETSEFNWTSSLDPA